MSLGTKVTIWYNGNVCTARRDFRTVQDKAKRVLFLDKDLHIVTL